MTNDDDWGKMIRDDWKTPPPPANTDNYKGGTSRGSEFAMWLVVVVAMAFVIYISWCHKAHAEFCYTSPNKIEEPERPGYRWQWRLVDNKKCWYYSNRTVPVVELVWRFTEADFNSDIERVIERKFEERFFAPRVKDRVKDQERFPH